MTTPDARTRGSLFGFLTEQRRVVYLLVALLSAAGLWEAGRLPSAIYPELVFSRITVVANGSSLGAREVLFSITRPIEEAISVVPGVTRVQSRAIRGGSEINITFAEQTDMQSALEQTRARVNRILGELPAGLDVEVERMTPSLFPVLSYNLEGGDPATLYDIAQYQIRPLFTRVPGVARVDVQASDIRELQVVADPARLAAQGLTYEALADAIRQSTAVRAVGRMPSNYRQYLIVTTTEARAAEDVANVMIGHGLHVRDVATVTMGTEDHVRIIAGDAGRPAALLNITRQIGSNTIVMADSIDALATSVRRTLPPGVRLTPMYDQAKLVREAVASVRDAMLIGAALAVLVLLVFLRHARVTAISASSILLSMVITIFVMARMGQTFNLMTLGAMAIATGLVIDNAVVVTENIIRHLHFTSDRTLAVREALRELVWPVTTSTLTTVVVFLPLGLLTGVEGQFFQVLSVTLTIAVLVSLLLALSFIPLLSAQYLSVRDMRDAAAETGLLARLGAWVDLLSHRYERSLGTVIQRRRTVLVTAFVLVAAGVATHRFVGTGFLPEMDEGAFVLDYWTPGGTALAETDRMVQTAERILSETPEVEGSSRRTGAELGLFATQQNRGDVVVRLKPRSQRSRTSEEIIDDVRKRIESAEPRMRIEFVQILADVIGDLTGNARPIEVKLFGPDLNTLESYAKSLSGTVAKVKGLEDFYNGVSEPSAELMMSYRTSELNRLGYTPAQVSDAVSGALLGTEAGTLRLDDRTVGIRVRAPDSLRFNPWRLGALPVIASPGAPAVPLGAVATFTPAETRAELLRENQQQLINMTAGITGRSLGDVMRDLQGVLATHPAPDGVRVELAGQYRSQQKAFTALLVVLALAAVSVVTVMLVQFESFIESLVVLVAAPLSFVGALVMLLVTRTPLNVSSFMGLILLVGLIVKNGIILLDFTRHRMREGGLALEPAIRQAAAVRLRPILMTTLCTLFGLLPLALGLGTGSEMQKPLALAVIGGLALSTPITLFIVPTLLVAIRGRDWRLTTTK